MTIFSFKTSPVNVGQLDKGGTDRPAYRINFADGILPGITVTSYDAIALDEDGAVATSLIYNSMSVTNGVATVKLKTGGAGGTAAATDGARFRVRTTLTLSDSGILAFDTFVRIVNPAYLPEDGS